VNAGVYVHLPYCASRCGYCSFVVSTDPSSRAAYVEALSREIDLVAGEARQARFDSIYLGGGTPSLIPPVEISSLLERIRARLTIDPATEVTLEANPEDVTAKRRDAWIDAGVSRVSVGVQSFEDRELAAVGRRHDAARARRALGTLQGHGMSLSGDLILGLPEQTAESFRRSVAALCDSGVGHVSVYLLEAEKSRSLEQDRRLRPDRYLSEDAQADVWLEMGRALADRGFRHYEVSNWALPGQEARHNTKYWQRAPTLGLGVSAHEYWQGRRRANVSVLAAYVERLQRGERPVALDASVGPEEEAAERIVLGLRLSAGVDRGEIEEWIARSGDPRLPADYTAWRERGLLRDEGQRLALTERGFLLSNEILCRFV
jgi:oxygen-independent coproporphyrinogen-3 oxidase